jgi:hypothetical protein
MNSTLTRKPVSKSAAHRVAIVEAGFGSELGLVDFVDADPSYDPERALDGFFIEDDPSLGDGSGIEDAEGYALRALNFHTTTQSAAKSDELDAEYDEVARAALADRISSKRFIERDDQEAFLDGIAKAINAKLGSLHGVELGNAIADIEVNIADLPSRFGFGAYDCEGVAKSRVVRSALRRAIARYDAWEAPILAEAARKAQQRLARDLSRALRQQDALTGAVRVARPKRVRKPRTSAKATAPRTNRSSRRSAKANTPGSVGTVATKPSTAKGGSATPNRNRRRHNRRPVQTATK